MRTAIAASVVPLLLLSCSSGDDDSDSADRDELQDPAEQAEQLDQAVSAAECMRDNGYEDYPDPQVASDGRFAIGASPGGGLEPTDEFEADLQSCIEESGLDGFAGKPGAGDGSGTKE